MKLKMIALATLFYFGAAAQCFAQDLGPQVKKLADGVYAWVGNNFSQRFDDL